MNPSPAAAIRSAALRLADAGVASPAADARTLLLHVTGTTPAELLGMRTVAEPALARYEELVSRRCARVPLQHLTGRAWFRHVELAVGPGVFVPRPETELVAGAAIAEARRHQGALVVELCAGSGAISAAVLDEVPGAAVVAIEREPDAARWLRRNLDDPRAEVVEADIADPLPRLDARAHVVVANPPYVPASDLAALPPEVRDHDPHAALFAGDDGLELMPTVFRVARRLLRPGGLVVVEHGDDQRDRCLALLARAGFGEGAGHDDLAGRARFVTGRLV